MERAWEEGGENNGHAQNKKPVTEYTANQRNSESKKYRRKLISSEARGQ